MKSYGQKEVLSAIALARGKRSQNDVSKSPSLVERFAKTPLGSRINDTMHVVFNPKTRQEYVKRVIVPSLKPESPVDYTVKEMNQRLRRREIK